MARVLILHGWEDSSKSGFIPSLVSNLRDKGFETQALDLPNTEAPEFEGWFAFAEKEIEGQETENMSVVGHSMGGLLTLKLAEKHKFRRIILVCPVGSNPPEDYFNSFTDKLSKEEMATFKNFQSRGLDADRVKQNCQEIHFIFGKSDPWITEEIRDLYTEKFGDVAKISIIEGGHLSEGEGVKSVPEVESIFK